jgi:hypothetical protein
VDWIDLAQIRSHCRAVVNTLMKCEDSQNAGKFWSSSTNGGLTRGLSSMELVNVCRQQTRWRKVFNWMAADISRVLSSLNFFLNQIFIVPFPNIWTAVNLQKNSILRFLLHSGDGTWRCKVNATSSNYYSSNINKKNVMEDLRFSQRQWDIAPCSPHMSRRFWGTYHLHLQGRESAE